MIKSKISMAIISVLVLSFVVVPAFADTIRISPNGDYWGSIMLASPATFYANVTGSNGAGTHDVNLLLVIPKSCYDALTDTVTVSWAAGSNTLTLGGWTAGSVDVTWTGAVSDNGVKLPPTALNGYTVASLKDHLDTDEAIYWAFVPILDGAILMDDDGIPFTVTLPSDEPKMGLWLIGQNPDSNEFDNQTPTTQPGFVIPELSTIFLATSSLIAFALFVQLRKKR
jgi:hypothetical protein